MWLECPYLGRSVELTDERAAHIAATHEVDAATILESIPLVVAAPQVAFQAEHDGRQYLLAREIDRPTGTKHIVVIIVAQTEPDRLWIVTAFIARRLPGGDRWRAI